jgi:hypothetical protein
LCSGDQTFPAVDALGSKSSSCDKIRISPPIKHTATAAMAKRIDTAILPALFAQQRLYFLPLPQGQGALRPMADIRHLARESGGYRRTSVPYS